MPSAVEHESKMISALAISAPTLNTALGTPVRKLISAVAQELANYSVDQSTTNTLYALESVSGQDLDYLVGQFGFTRQEARSAYGTVTIKRDNADSFLSIAYGAQFYKPATSTSEAIVFSTTAYQEMEEGVVSAEIAVRAVLPGASGNVAANTITYSNAYAGYITVTNEYAMTGGRDAETDADLRSRFIKTVFRSLAGTRDQYLGLALAHEDVSKALVVGRESRYSEIVTVKEEDGSIFAKVSDDQWDLDVDHAIDTDYRYWITNTDTGEMLQRGSYEVVEGGKKATFFKQSAEELVGPVSAGYVLQLSHKNVSNLSVKVASSGAVPSDGEDYVLDPSNGTMTIPSDTSIPAGDSLYCTYQYYDMSVGDFVTIEFDYFSKLNRGGLKSAELFVDAVNPQKVSDIQYLDFDKKITEDNVDRWVRNDGSKPEVGHLYVPVSYQPAYESSGMVNVGVATILNEGADFLLIRDATKNAGSSRAFDAIELIGEVQDEYFVFADENQPKMDDETPMNIPYYYNKDIGVIQELIDRQSVVTMDTMVHETRKRKFIVHLSVMYSTYPRDDVKASVENAVRSWAQRLEMGSTVQFSDIETVVANLAGVDNVRVARQSDAGNAMTSTEPSTPACGLVEVERDGVTLKGTFDQDFKLAKADEMSIESVVVYARSQQDW